MPHTFGLRSRTSTVLACVLWTISALLVAISLATARPGGPNDLLAAVGQGIAALMLVTVGAVLVSRLPRHVIGWLLAIGGLVIAIAVSSSGLADYGLNVHPGTVPAAIWLAWLSQWLWAPEIACLFILLPLYYPTGRLPSSRWRVVALIAASVAVVGGVGSALSPWAPDPFPVQNPFALGGSAADLLSVGDAVLTVLVVLGGALAVTSLFVRYRRAATIERQQLKWFAAVAMITGVAGTINIGAYNASGAAAPTGTLGTIIAVSGFFIFAGLALLPVAIGVAVLRYRLYEIDTLINRAIVYGLLTAILAGSSAALIAFGERLFEGAAGPSSDVTIVLTTLVVVGAFSPIKSRLQTIVDRRFKEVPDPAVALGRFVDEVRRTLSPPDLERTLRRFLEVGVGAYHATGGRVVARRGTAVLATSVVGSPTAEGPFVVSVERGPLQAELTLSGVDGSDDPDAVRTALESVLAEVAGHAAGGGQ